MRLWKRLSESADSDDNPGISDYVGRGELAVRWNVNKDNTLGATFRSSLASSDRGSVRLEWMQALGSNLWGGKSNLRLHRAVQRLRRQHDRLQPQAHRVQPGRQPGGLLST